MPLNPDVFIERHAIRAAKVAPVGDRDPKIAHWSAKAITSGHGGIITHSILCDVAPPLSHKPHYVNSWTLKGHPSQKLWKTLWKCTVTIVISYLKSAFIAGCTAFGSPRPC